jgi:hypothetical protein
MNHLIRRLPTRRAGSMTPNLSINTGSPSAADYRQR